MDTNSTGKTPEQLDCRVTQTQLGEKFAALRNEASKRAESHRKRLERVAKIPKDAAKRTKSRPESSRDSAVIPRRLETAQNTNDVFAPVSAPQQIERKHVSKPQNLDLIALWSVVGPSTIAAVFAGVAMSQNQIPIVYALAFIFAWFAITSCMALGAVKVVSTRTAASFMRASAPRLGLAAIACALVSVLLVEATRMSITAIAAQVPSQTDQKIGALDTGKADQVAQEQRVAPSRTFLMAKSSAARPSPEASTRSVHFQTTPSILPAKSKQVQLEGTAGESIVALPAPAPEFEEQNVEQSVAKAPQRNTSRGELLGRISEKGKFVARTKGTKGSSKKNRVTVARKANRQKSNQGSRNILEKIFDPVINSAGAQPPSRGIGSADDRLDGISR